MTTEFINSEPSLQSVIGELREMYKAHKYLKLTITIGKSRSPDQNAISHAWYSQLARELREEDALGWKCFCKLTIGVPILRAAEDDQFRTFYDGALKRLTYEEKLNAMKFVPVTSIMTKPQLSSYLEAMQAAFADRVKLEFPEEEP